MNDLTECNDTVIEPDIDLHAENASLKAEIERRDKAAEQVLQNKSAVDMLSLVYADFHDSLAEIEKLGEAAPYLDALPAEQRYRILYTMLCGERYLLQREDTKAMGKYVYELLDDHPEFLCRYLQDRVHMGSKVPPRFSFGESKGIFSKKEKIPTTFPEARNAALRYVKHK